MTIAASGCLISWAIEDESSPAVKREAEQDWGGKRNGR
jgi:hypothetical protein